MISDDIDQTLIRYFSGQLDSTERADFDRWLAETPGRRPEIERLRQIWAASAEAPAAPDTEAALLRVKQRSVAVPPVLTLQDGAAQAARPDARPVRSPWRRPAAFWRIAASVVLLIGGGVLAWSLATRGDVPNRLAPGARTYATARAERATLTLPDGTKILLHNESTLEVPANFGAGARDVYLRGEGYFEVAHDSMRPFRVHGGGAVTRVLGTKFAVRARPGEDSVQVVVAEGRVALRPAGAPDSAPGPVLTRGSIGVLGESGRVVVRTTRDIESYLGWTEGRLVFAATPLPEALKELGRWYDREFVLDDSTLAASRFTTTLRDGSLAEAMTVLETSLDVRAVIDGRRIVLRRANH